MRIEQLHDQTRVDRFGEVVRRAIAVYDPLLTKDGEGASVIVRNDAGSEQHVVLLDWQPSRAFK